MKKKHGQMSEALSTGIFLTLSGGLQDAYTYFYRGKVFGNAQTGNLILMGHHFAMGEWAQGLRYLAPLFAFLCGIYAAESVRRRFKDKVRVHWRQLIVLLEIVLLFIVGFIPQDYNLLANGLVSFVCAMQVETFRKMNGNTYASTMCIGNLRSATEHVYTYLHTRSRQALHKSIQYYGVVLVFAAGAVIGSILTGVLGAKTIWVSCALLSVSFGIMFIKPGEDKMS